MAGYDAQGYLPPDLAPTMPVWAQPDTSHQDDVNKLWYLEVPVGKWNMTSFNYNQYANKPGEPATTRFCALNKQDFEIPPGQVGYSGQHGDVFPNCYVRPSDADGRNRKFFEQAQMAQTLYANGKLEATSEINTIDPWGLQPCAGTKTIFEVLLPVATAIFAGIATGELLGFVVAADAPQAIKSVLTLGAVAFGWEFGTAISEGDETSRRQIFETSSKIVGTSVGAAATLTAVYFVSDKWQSHEVLWLAGGGVAGFFVLSPLVLPFIDNFSLGIIGVLWRFLNGIIGLVTGVVCGISNWDVDGCSVGRNPNARSWDRTLLSAAAVDEMANNYDLDTKQKEVAYQALLLNAASYSAALSPYDVANQVAAFDSERGWNGTINPDPRINSYSAFGPLVQASLNEDPAWYEKLSGGTYYPYYWTMFAKDSEKSLLQKCATADELLSDTKMQTWMSDAHKLALQGKSQRYPISVPFKMYNCETIFSGFLQQTEWKYGLDWIKDFHDPGVELGLPCKTDDPVRYYMLRAFAACDTSTTEGELIRRLDAYIKREVPSAERNASFFGALLSTLEKWRFPTQVGSDQEALQIWANWYRYTVGGTDTQCEAVINAIETIGSKDWRALGNKADAYAPGPSDCTAERKGKFDAYTAFFGAKSCDEAVQRVTGSNDEQYKCGVGSALDFAQGCAYSASSRNLIDEWVAACSQ